MIYLQYIVLLAFNFAPCLAQTSQPALDPSLCAKGSPIKAFPNCTYMDNATTTCNSTTSDEAQFLSCFCTQAILNSIIGCENEFRLCFEDDDYDSSAQQMLSIWHQGCDDFISFTPTTPPLSTPSTTYVVDACTSIYSSCAAGSYAFEQCSSSFPTATQSQVSCACQPSVLSLAYTCEFIGNQTCLQTSAALSNVFGYSFCPDFMSLFASASIATPSAVSASVTPSPGSVQPTSATAISGSGSVTAFNSNSKPTLPSLSTSTPSASTKSSQASDIIAPYTALLISLLLTVIMN